MEAHGNEADHAAHRIGHVVPLKVLSGIFASLVMLTILTVAVSKVDLGEYNLVIALLIAVCKASLVVLFFMHMRWEKPFNGIVFIGCLIFVGLFIGLTLLDTMQYQGSKLQQEAKGVQHVPLQGGDAGVK